VISSGPSARGRSTCAAMSSSAPNIRPASPV
jgi:hypothetical protein